MRVGIVGIGLIGGSLGKALRGLNRSLEVVGLTRSEESAAEARKLGAVDRASASASILQGSDVVVVCTPIDQIEAALETTSDLLLSGTVVTDVASVKRPVRDWVRRLPEPGLFLGGHPVAGKTQSGLAASDPAIFRNEPWVFTPLEAQNLRPFEAWFELVAAIGARVRFLSPEEHDRQMAYLSHLPFTLSSVLAATVAQHADSQLAGPGYRGMVRLNTGDPAMYESISRANREGLMQAIDDFSQTLQQYRQRIEGNQQLRTLFEGDVHVAV
jgi:prephenate dehydrogenase